MTDMANKYLPVAIAAALFLTGCGTELLAIPAAAPVPSFTSVPEAEKALEQATRDRVKLESEFAERERVCHERFFVNRCLDEAKEKRRVGMGIVRAIEVEAERYKRETAANDHDRELARVEAQLAVEEASRAAAPPPPTAPEVTEPPKPTGKPLAQRLAEKAARDAARAKKDAANATRRAKAVADREARRAESLRRQQQVEEKRKAREEEKARDTPAQP
jgi:hypothetical protein